LANGYLAPADQVSLYAICVDRNDGQIEHQVELFRVDQAPILHSHNTYASPTPVLDDSTAYFHFGTMGTAAVDRASGSVLWQNRDFVFDHETGPGSSPILWQDLLIFHCDGTDQQFIVALRQADGSVAWQQDRSGELHPDGMMQKAFSTPTLAVIDGRELLISVGAHWVYAYEPATGEETWKVSYGHDGFSNVPRPVVRDNVAYVCTGFSRAVLMAIDLRRAASDPKSAVLWTHKTQVPTIPSPIVVDDLLFMVGGNWRTRLAKTIGRGFCSVTRARRRQGFLLQQVG
jgi:outer membrane protein assembly factor BamB